MRVFYPNGTPFLSFEEIVAQRNRMAEERNRLAEERNRLAEERNRLAEELRQQDAERQRQQTRAGVAEQRAARLAALSRKARRGQASPEELQELDRLEGEGAPPA
jgi:hypothetical protein